MDGHEACYVPSASVLHLFYFFDMRIVVGRIFVYLFVCFLACLFVLSLLYRSRIRRVKESVSQSANQSVSRSFP